MTVSELCELIDRVVDEPDLYLRIQKGRELRLAVAKKLRIPSKSDSSQPEHT